MRTWCLIKVGKSLSVKEVATDSSTPLHKTTHILKGPVCWQKVEEPEVYKQPTMSHTPTSFWCGLFDRWVGGNTVVGDKQSLHRLTRHLEIRQGDVCAFFPNLIPTFRSPKECCQKVREEVKSEVGSTDTFSCFFSLLHTSL